MNDLIDKQYLAHIPTLPLLAVLFITISLAYICPIIFAMFTTRFQLLNFILYTRL